MPSTLARVSASVGNSDGDQTAWFAHPASSTFPGDVVAIHDRDPHLNKGLSSNFTTVGPASTMNVDGKINSTSGKLSFTDALAACSSALYCRVMRRLSAWM